jgi:hypothetical protein
MRQLTAKQKKILKKYPDCYCLEQLPSGVWEQLEAINDTEILWQETNRFLGDNHKPNYFKSKMW